MTLAPAREARSQELPDPTELLIKEARQKMLRRRHGYVAVVLIVLVAAVAIWQGSGGTTHPTSPLRANTSSPKSGSPSGSSNLAALSVLGGQSLNQVDPFGPKTVWVWTANEVALTGGGQDLELTTNAGRSWANVTPPSLRVDGGTHWINGFFALSPTRAWLVYGGVNVGPQLLETTSDAGQHWSKVGAIPAGGCSLQFVSASEGTCTVTAAAAGSEANRIYRTDNGGESWRLVFTNVAQSMESNLTVPVGSTPFGCDKSVQFESSAKGFVFFWCNGGTGANIYGTTNGGVTWAPRNVAQPTPIPKGGGGFSGAPVFNGSKGAIPYVAGSYSAVFVTSDGGASFHPVYPPGKRQPWAVDLLSPSQWRLTNGKEILATNNGGTSWFAIMSGTVLRTSTYVKGAPPGGLVDFVSANDGWLTENQYNANSTLLRTTDEGRTWRKVAVPGTEKL